MSDVVEVKIFKGNPAKVEEELNNFLNYNEANVVDIKLLELTKTNAVDSQILAMVLLNN